MDIENPDTYVKIVQVIGNQGIPGEKGVKGDKGEPGATYDDTDLKNRVTTLENTVGTLNDSMEEILNG